MSNSGYLERPDGGSIYYEEHNPLAVSKPTLLFSQTLFWDTGLFEHQIERFAGEGYRCVAYDHRGQNKSSRSDDVISVEDSYIDMLALIKELDLAPVVVVGNSYGGFMGFRLACRHPELAKGVLCLGSNAEQQDNDIPQTTQEEFLALAQNIEDLGPGHPELSPQIMYIMFGDEFLNGDTHTGNRSRWLTHLENLDTGVGQLARGAALRAGVLGELGDCRVPMWLVHGREDHAFPYACSEKAYAALPDTLENKKLVLLDRCGHSVATEAPDVLNDIIAEFLTSLEHQ